MSYRFSDHLQAARAVRKSGPSREDCPSCGETVTSGTDECPFCGASMSAARRTRAKGRWFTAAAWILILAFLVPTLLVLVDFLRSR